MILVNSAIKINLEGTSKVVDLARKMQHLQVRFFNPLLSNEAFHFHTI